MTPVVIPQIETQRLWLRGPIPADVDMWAACLADDDVTRFVPKAAGTFRERAERTLNAYQRGWERHPPDLMGWVIAGKADGRLIGLCCIDTLERTGDGELAYFLCGAAWGQGFMTEAVRAMVRYGFEHGRWDRMVAYTVPANAASGRVLEHIGFVYEKNVDYREVVGAPNMSAEFADVRSYSLPRERFAPGTALYRVLDAGPS
jgi:ribosomal-protein-alanine N-acetyltransferase